MKVLLYHPVVLPPRDYGGVERVVLWLSEGLRDLGHSVTIACLAGSRLPSGVEFLAVGLDEPVAKISALRNFDLVHFHSPPARIDELPIPHLVTIHGNGRTGEVFFPNTVFLSRDHAARHGRSAYVYNGANPAEFQFRDVARVDARPLFLSKTSWRVKNLAGAMKLCRKARTGITIAGGRRPYLCRLESFLRPGFDWAGAVSGSRKAELLAEASCLLFPVQWPEPFGLVMIEAMLSGTPVIGSRLGSIPEVVGAVGGHVLAISETDRWVQALRNAKTADRSAIRKYALENFTHLRMAENYLAYYQKSIRGEPIR